MDNSILSIKMEVSNLKKQQSVHDSENLQSIEVEASQIDRLLSVAMKAKELEKALVPKHRKRVEVATYIETYLKNYVPSRADVRVLLEWGQDDAEILCDTSSFAQMLDKVLSNCVDYADENSNIVVRHATQGSGNSLIEIFKLSITWKQNQNPELN